MFDQPIDTEVSMQCFKRQNKPLLTIAEAQACRLAGDVSESQLRFLRVARAKGKEMEPAGRLAGAHV
jgi:hypothetical protein